MKKSLIALACGMLLVVVGVLMPLILFLTVVNRADASAGIIGGADGPTAIFLTPQLFSSSLFAITQGIPALTNSSTGISGEPSKNTTP